MPTAGFAPDRRSRAVAITAAIALQMLVGLVLINGLSGRVGRTPAADLKIFDIAEVKPPPPPRVVPVVKAARRPAGAAAPPRARAVPTPVVAPPPVVRLPPPPPLVVAAPVAALGTEADAGAADRGEGTGAGGEGDGRGAGPGGDGTGAGGTPARQIAGSISGRDYPPAARVLDIEGEVITRYVIDTHGRIDRCSILQSSGSEVLDATTCRLSIKRFRYAPARDASGRPVEDVIDDTHHWHINRDAQGE